jgi:hypothetical protein
VPMEIEVIAFQNQTVVYDILFRAASETLCTIAPIQNIWEQRSASSAYYTRGDKTCYTTRIFIFSSLGVASRLTANIGLPACRISFCLSECCRRCSGASSCTTWRRPSALES